MDKKKTIFISWSGDSSKKIALALKDSLENDIFQEKELCFVSDTGIKKGDNWYAAIKHELANCKYGIACITKENISAPWIFFESGAIETREVPIIPLLVSARYSYLDKTPLAARQAVDLRDEKRFCEMVCDLNSRLNISSMKKEQLNNLAKTAYSNLMLVLKDELERLEGVGVFSNRFIYPRKHTTINIDTIFVSLPMATLSETEYTELRTFLLKLQKELKRIGFKKVICPMLEIKSKKEFEGSTKASLENFAELKQVDSMVVIYPKPLPSSLLIELGYGIALTKKIVIYVQDDVRLPYILQDASGVIDHVKIRSYSDYDSILKSLSSNGRTLFRIAHDEEK